MYFFIFSNVRLDAFKILFCSLSSIYGIGFFKSNYVCWLLGLNCFQKMKNLSYYHFYFVSFLYRYFFVTTNRLKNLCFLNLKKLIDIKSYKGLRYISNLPMRGQRTSTNARSSKKRYLYNIHFFELTKKIKTSQFLKKNFNFYSKKKLNEKKKK